ncbi:MAG: hypothetical protein ACYSU1_09035, partial [Planctomycetota bacterium]
MMLAFCLVLAFAQDPQPPSTEGLSGSQLQTRSIDSAEEGDAMVYRIAELAFESPEVFVRADRVTIWFDAAAYRQRLGLDEKNGSAQEPDPKAAGVVGPEPPATLFAGLWSRRVLAALGLPEDDDLIREIRLEGHVEIFGGDLQLRCDRLQDFPAEGRSRASMVVLDLPPGSGGPNGWPLRLSADTLEEHPDGTLSADQAIITTCLDRPPHYGVFFDSLTAEPQEDGAFVWHPSGGWLELGGVPFLPVPTPDFSPGSNFLGFRGI